MARHARRVVRGKLHVMAEERTWDQRIFDVVDPGVDATLLEENLRRTPTERIERMLSMLRLAEDLRNARGHGHSPNR